MRRVRLSLSLVFGTDAVPIGMADVIGYPANPPKSELARYRLLSPSAAVRVSPICLGGMSLGEQWSGWMGGKSLNQAQSEELLDAYQ